MREIVKLAAVAAVILIAAVLIGLFASQYMAAFKPGGKGNATSERVVGSNAVRGGVSVAGTPTPSPSQGPGPRAPGAVPGAPMQPPFQQNPPSQSAGQPQQEPYGPAMPTIQPLIPAPTPVPFEPVPINMPGMPGNYPVIGPTPSIERPAQGSPGETSSPFVLGWMQIIQRFVTILPFIFPGIMPFYSWWPGGL